MWPNAYRYRVYSGIRMVGASLEKHIPSHVVVAGYRALISYGGGAADNLSQLQRAGSSANCVPAQTAGASGMQTGNNGIMGGSGGEGGPFQTPRQ